MTWYLRSEVGPGAPDAGQFAYGAPGWKPVVGDWDGNGTDTVGLFAPDTATWYLRNENSPGAPDAGQFAYGFTTWKPVAGAWTVPATSGATPASAPGTTNPDGAVQVNEDLLAGVLDEMGRRTQVLDSIFSGQG
jgi:hypothetical protein